jgi:glycosyltransferase involved in cell wall biosynthesis
MRVLVLTERFPYPPSNGGMLRTHHLIRGVAERHDVEIACFAHTDPKVTYPNTTVYRVPPPSFTSTDRAFALLQPMPVYPLANRTAEMSALIRRVCESRRPDICHIDTLGMCAYGRELKIPFVVDLMDCVSLHYERLVRIQTNPLRRALYAFEGRKITRFERQVAQTAGALVCCTTHDAGAMKAITGKNVLTIRNGVETPARLNKTFPTDPVIVFLGFLEYAPNRDAIEFFGDHIWPHILEGFPRARFEIIGKGPAVTFRNMTNVHFRGYVDDLALAYNDASVMVAPIRAGSGVKNKVLEAMAYGVPVVATSLAVEGIDGVAGQHYLVADEPGTFAGSVQRLLCSPELSRTMGLAGREFVRVQFDWTRATQEFVATYEGLLNR